MKYFSGFTLIELLVVIGILASLSVVGTYSYNNQVQNTRDQRRIANAEMIRANLELFKSNQANSFYPATLAILGAQFPIPPDPGSGSNARTFAYNPRTSTGGACSNLRPNFCTTYTLHIILESGRTHVVTPNNALQLNATPTPMACRVLNSTGCNLSPSNCCTGSICLSSRIMTRCLSGSGCSTTSCSTTMFCCEGRRCSGSTCVPI